MLLLPIRWQHDVLHLIQRSDKLWCCSSLFHNLLFWRYFCKVTKSREQNKRIYSFFCRDGVSSMTETSKLRKKMEEWKKITELFAWI